MTASRGKLSASKKQKRTTSVERREDIRNLPLSMRKTNLARLLARRVDGIHLAPFEQGEIGPDLFRHASA